MANKHLVKRLVQWLKATRVTSDRAEVVIKIISDGSAPHLGFYALIAASSLIASIGLLTNSAPVVIGAMLVSPLMTPIFGMALGMVRGESAFFLRALRAEGGGVALAILFGVIFGSLNLTTETTPEIAARLRPNLLDLLVAVFAGIAGTWAIIDERISPVLPGVAISTAIIPPLSVSGLCLATGAYAGAQGAFLLFFANFLAILMVSSLIFLWIGLASRVVAPKRGQLLPRLVVTVASFLILAAFLTHSLIQFIVLQQRQKASEQVFLENQDKLPSYTLMNVQHRETKGKILVVAKILTPKAFSPARVSFFEKEIGKRIGRPVLLLVRCVLSQDVSSQGFAGMWVDESLNGIDLRSTMNADVRRVKGAELILRETLAAQPEIFLRDVDLVRVSERPVILASVRSTMRIVPEEVENIQKKIREHLKDPTLHLVVRNMEPIDTTAHGRVLLGEPNFGPLTNEEEEIVKWTQAALNGLAGLHVSTVVPVLRSHQSEVYTEIVGERVLRHRELVEVEREVSAKANKKVRVMAWSKAESVVTESGVQSMESFITQELKRRNLLLK